MARVAFEHIWKRFADTVAVRDFSLEVTDGEFLVLVGPSGSGKSTLLRMLAGLDEISDGTIRIGDRVVNHVAAKDRDIAMVFQTYALYPHMTVAANMAFGLRLRGIPKPDRERLVREAAALLGIEELLSRKPGQLSGGQRQRVALGRAIVREPAVFLLDEPLSNLDAKLRVQTRSEISKLHARLGTTFVYVTHDQVEAMTMADRIAVLNLGELQQVGTPQELYDHPANIFVAGFIGSPAMNLFEATPRLEGERFVLKAEGFALEIPPEAAAALQPLAGRRLAFGVRPEDIHDPDYHPSGIVPATLEAAVDLTEAMGNETFLHLERDGTSFLARVDPRSPASPGQTVHVLVDLAHLHAFDPETGETIAAAPAAAVLG